jgi:hypothetical protein
VVSTEGISYTGFHAGSFSVSDETRAAAPAARRRVRVMSTTLHPFPSRPEPVAVPAARLALKADGTPRGLLDGAWWPRSRDLLSELPALTDVLDPLWGRITRIAVNPAYWPVVPHAVPVRGHIVKVGWFTPELDPHKLLLLSYGNARWDLLIVPPEAGAASATRLMTAASDQDGPLLTASALIAADRTRQTPHAGSAPADRPAGAGASAAGAYEAWEGEGGAPSTATTLPEQAGHVGRPVVGR